MGASLKSSGAQAVAWVAAGSDLGVCQQALPLSSSSSEKLHAAAGAGLDHVSEITQEVAAEVCREGLGGLGCWCPATPVTPRPCCISTVSDGEQGWGATVNSYHVLSAGIANSLLLLVSKR